MKRLTITLLILLFSVETHAATVWRAAFQDASGTTITASVGSNATYVGGDNISTKRVTGPGGDFPFAISFNGTDDSCDIGALLALNTKTTWSVMAWIRQPGGYLATNAPWFTIDDSSAATGTVVIVYGCQTTYFSAVNGSTVSANGFRGIYQNNSTANYVGGATSHDPTEWHHYAALCDGTNRKLFVDGTQVATRAVATALANSVQLVQVGAFRTSQFCACEVCDVRIFDDDQSPNLATIMADADDTNLVPVLIDQRRRRD